MEGIAKKVDISRKDIKIVLLLISSSLFKEETL